MDYAEKAMELHRKLRGKLEMHTRTETGTREALSIAYTPGVAAPCLAIKEDPTLAIGVLAAWTVIGFAGASFIVRHSFRKETIGTLARMQSTIRSQTGL